MTYTVKLHLKTKTKFSIRRIIFFNDGEKRTICLVKACTWNFCTKDIQVESNKANIKNKPRTAQVGAISEAQK